MSDARNIVIVGGGFAGTTLARRLEARLPADHRVVLVSEESYTTFNPMLAEVVGAAVFPEHVVAPIRQMLRTSRFIMARATAVDVKHRVLTATTLDEAIRGAKASKLAPAPEVVENVIIDTPTEEPANSVESSLNIKTSSYLDDMVRRN